MGVWDVTTPAGSDPKAQGDDRIRELKAALQEALSHEDSTFPGATPSSTPIFIPGFLRGATGSRPTGDSLVSGRIYFNTTLNVIERYNGATWDVIETTPGADSVTGAKIADDAIDSEHYAAGSIDLEHMSANSVDSDQYVDGSIDLIHMSANSVDSDQYVDGSIDGVHIANDAIDSQHYAAASIDLEHLSSEVLDQMSSPASIQQFAKTVTVSGGSDTSATVSANSDQTITAVDTTKSYVIVHGVRATAQAGFNPSFISGSARLTASTTVNVVVCCGGDSANNSIDIIVDFTVVEWN